MAFVTYSEYSMRDTAAKTAHSDPTMYADHAMTGMASMSLYIIVGMTLELGGNVSVVVISKTDANICANF